jgi:UDP-N-acetylmuramate: L-alanyl-gamma-D-glutamyl-meso-diaminopimelate ligase
LVPRRGRVLVWGENGGVKACTEKAFCPVETFGLDPGMDWCAGDIEWSDGATQFRVAYRGREVRRIRMSLAGRHNVLDALAAIGLAYGRGVECEAIERAMETFQGVRRRMEVKGEPGGVLVVEDFAHHPTAIRVTLDAVRMRWPGRRIWAAIEPRSNTMRRKIFQDVLPEALAGADKIIFGPVSRAQLLAGEERMEPAKVAEDLRARGKDAQALGSATEIAEYLAREARRGDLILVMTNGSFDGLNAKLLEKLEQRK